MINPSNRYYRTISGYAKQKVFNLGGELLGDTRYVYFKFTITDNTTTNVGIKIPITMITDVHMPNFGKNGLNVQDVAEWDDEPDRLSSTGTPIGFDRNDWVVLSDSEFYSFYTTNSTQKSALTIGETYWFSVEVVSSDGNKNDEVIVDVGVKPFNIITARSHNIYTMKGLTTVLDIND